MQARQQKGMCSLSRNIRREGREPVHANGRMGKPKEKATNIFIFRIWRSHGLKAMLSNGTLAFL